MAWAGLGSWGEPQACEEVGPCVHLPKGSAVVPLEACFLGMTVDAYFAECFAVRAGGARARELFPVD